MTIFQDYKPTKDNYWRSIILFGRNVASYKFALGHALLKMATNGNEIVTLEELAVPFSQHICRHLRLADKQGTSKSSTFLKTCRKFNSGTTRKDELIDATKKLGFVNVIDAFHIVQGNETSVRFFTDERRGQENGIRLTQDLFSLAQQSQMQNLNAEVEARWRLVETAWGMKLPKHVLTVKYQRDEQVLIANSRAFDRKVITGCRGALNGYQKGKCFYCNRDISVVAHSNNLADVDHFIPHLLEKYQPLGNLDGVWNLVLACRPCNRAGGKFDKLPVIAYLEQLAKRNNFLINSHHPLRETLISQTGNSEQERNQFLQGMYHWAKAKLPHSWQPSDRDEEAF